MAAPNWNIVLACFESAPAELFTEELNEPGGEVLRRLAREGLRFARAFTNSPGTIEALVSLFAGLAPAAHGATSETPTWPAHAPDAVSGLRNLGYGTVAVCPVRDVAEQICAKSRFHWLIPPQWRLGLVERGWLLGRRVAGRWLRGNEGLARRTNLAFFHWLDHYRPARPFFAWLYYPSRHAEPLHGEKPADPFAPAIFAANYISGIVRALEQRKLWDTTIFVVTALRGTPLLRQEADSLDEDVVRIPLVLRLPVPGPGGFVVEEFCQLSDLSPTLLHLAGAEEELGAAGYGRILVRGNRVTAGPEAVVVEEYRGVSAGNYGMAFPGYRRRLLRTARFRFLWQTEEIPELYDVEADPAAKRDLALEQPKMVAVMRAQLFHWLAVQHAYKRGPASGAAEAVHQRTLRVVS